MADEQVFYSKELLAILQHQIASVSPETWHKIMNPYCGTCLAERGKALLEGKEPWRPSPMNS